MRQREGNRLAKQIAAGAAVVVLAVVAGIWWVVTNRIPTDPATMCPPVQHVPRTTLIVADRHLQLVQDPAQLLKAAIDAKSIEFVRYERVVVLAVEKDGITGAPLFEKCNPGRATDAVDLVETASRMERRYHNDFIAPLVAALKRAPARAAGEAPLVEVLSDVAKRRDFHFRGGDGARRLVMFSPWLQASPGLTQLQDCQSSYDTYSRGEFARRLPVDLKGLTLLPYMIAVEGSDRAFQRASLLGFWERMLGVPLRGDGAVSEPIKPPPACYYPTLEDEANRFLKLARGAMAACRLGEAQAHVKTAGSYAAEVVAASSIGAALRRNKERCDELARQRAEELQRQARASAAAASAAR